MSAMMSSAVVFKNSRFFGSFLCDTCLIVQIGYWNERRGYVNTAIYRPSLEEFQTIQNRTYVITTILVRLGKASACCCLKTKMAATRDVYRKLPT